MPDPAIRRLDPPEVAAKSAALADLLVDAVASGASIGYLAGLDRDRARRYWLGVAAADDGRAVLAAEDDEGVAGAVIVVPMATEFQPHRAEIVKLVVHRRARGRGIATALMQAAEEAARAMGRPVLSLYTRKGSEAERVYERLGWTRVGTIPDDGLAPDGRLADAAIFCKRTDRAGA